MALLSKKETDPVCGMKVEPSVAKWKHEHEGKTYYFCSEGCKKRFAENPFKFVASGPTGM